ncbi:hypothetical protein BDB00DRAFT_924775 [Zychaea mexicana]|uniref:uncharacterized protein n=1 Tax=Zychaea mexicana TaxID=64656 RepID=UPI0022FE9AE6|nr:uncharacterized protein BDB00DRAFT_924775 [Zychaea mexicana]KAI9498986.1 hypothetical protein BDB00DRAFT_924775 [Zychaea mexicana]
MVESSWRHILTIAQNHIHEYHHQGESNTGTTVTDSSDYNNNNNNAAPNDDEQRASQEFYDRERRMVHALDTLFQLAYEGSGYLAFIATITSALEPESPVAMAFLSHIVDRAALPSRETMAAVSPVILSRLNKPTHHLYSVLTSLVTPFALAPSSFTTAAPSTTTSKLRRYRRQPVTIQQWKRPCPQCRDPATEHHQQQQKKKPKKKKRYAGPSTLLKLNSAALWSLLAEKFAGDLCQELWTDQVGDLLLHFLADPEEDLRVRIFALNALEKFALTGIVKEAIIAHPCNIRAILLAVIHECEEANHHIFLMSPCSPVSSLSHNSSNNDPAELDMTSNKAPAALHPQALFKAGRVKYCLETMWRDTKMHLVRLFHRKHKGKCNEDVDVDGFDDGWSLDGHLDKSSEADSNHVGTNNSVHSFTGTSASSMLSDHIKQRASPPSRPEFMSHLNSFDTGFIPPEGKLRDDWTRYVQLAHCSRWALDNVFGDDEQQLACSWDLSHLKAIMNLFDATAHWKLGGNGLELRNDRPHFESIRATACVKKGKWYYETLLLTNGIMQLGWATSRCRFTPEEGYGVGDDCNGFAFDTYRTAVWADGSAVYPQSHSNVHCRAGDVLGSFLDLDNGLCTFFINGCDLGLTVEFEHPARQHCVSEDDDVEGISASPMLPPPPFNSSDNNNNNNNNSGNSNFQNEAARASTSSSSRKSKSRSSNSNDNKSVSLGLYPAVSLTTHQHVLLNFGDRPWMYPPPVSVKYKGISEAGKLDEHFKNRVLHYVQKRSKPRCKSQATSITTTTTTTTTSASVSHRQQQQQQQQPHTLQQQKHQHQEGVGGGKRATAGVVVDVDAVSNSSSSSYEWDGPLCTICFSEPKNVMLLPCRHTGWGGRCADALDMCPLCRADIEDRISVASSSPSLSNSIKSP